MQEEILEELKEENKTPTKNNIREKLGLDRIEYNNKYKIEEILSNIQFQVYSDMNFIEPLGLNKKTWKELLDYITNLQEENIKLKELCDKYEEEHNNEFQCWKKDRKELLDKRGRINKTIEYINTHYLNANEPELLNILQGDNK